MKVILLCGGYATRLYPLTENHPKPLLSVAGRPILEWILDRVKELHNIEGVYVVTNHRFTPQFSEWAASRRHPEGQGPEGSTGILRFAQDDIEVEIIDDQTTTNENRLGAIGDLAFVLREKKIGQEDLLVIAGDNFFDFSLDEFVRKAMTRGKAASLVAVDIHDRKLAKQYGILRTDENGRVLEFLEKPSQPPTTLASCGIYWLPAAARVMLDTYLASGHNFDQPGHYMRWLAEKNALFAVPLKGHWLDIGDRESYEKANKLVQDFQKKA